MVARMWERGNSDAVLVVVSIGPETMEISFLLPQKLELELQYYPLWERNAKDFKSNDETNCCSSMFLRLFTIAKTWNQSTYPPT